jgi:hypothetical protein
LVRIITLRHNFHQPKILRYRNFITFFVKYMKKIHFELQFIIINTCANRFNENDKGIDSKK